MVFLQSSQDSLEKENKSLYDAMKTATSQNAEIIAKYEEQIEVREHTVAKGPTISRWKGASKIDSPRGKKEGHPK